jgi:hypothetical protein
MPSAIPAVGGITHRNGWALMATDRPMSCKPAPRLAQSGSLQSFVVHLQDARFASLSLPYKVFGLLPARADNLCLLFVLLFGRYHSTLALCCRVAAVPVFGLAAWVFMNASHGHNVPFSPGTISNYYLLGERHLQRKKDRSAGFESSPSRLITGSSVAPSSYVAYIGKLLNRCGNSSLSGLVTHALFSGGSRQS